MFGLRHETAGESLRDSDSKKEIVQNGLPNISEENI
jgi:hypothetical protein